MANNIKQNIQRMPKPTIYFDNSNSTLKLYKIQNVTVIENPMLENEEDFAEGIAKAIEEAYLFSCHFGI